MAHPALLLHLLEPAEQPILVGLGQALQRGHQDFSPLLLRALIVGVDLDEQLGLLVRRQLPFHDHHHLHQLTLRSALEILGQGPFDLFEIPGRCHHAGGHQ